MIDMAIITPSVSAATLAEITPVAAARPAESRVAALIVDATRAGGAAPDADPDASTAATDPPENTPRRASRFASIARARARRLATLPSGMASWRAASLRVRPSRSHSTTAAR